MVSVTDIFLVWWLSSGRYGWSRLHRRLFERKYLVVALPSVSSLEDITPRLKEVQWTGPLHLFDCISYPQATWMKKRDDCDGFASLSAELLRQWNPASNPVLLAVVVRPIRFSHTVCVFVGPQGSLCFFDNDSNDSLICQGHQSYDEIMEQISRSARKLVCWDVRNPVTLEMIELHRS